MKDSKITIIVVCVVLIAAIIFYYSMNSVGPRYQWFENYRASNDQPYGLVFMRKMLESYRPGSKFILNDKEPISHRISDIENPAQTDYVFIGSRVFLDEQGVSALARFINDGGNVFIASLFPPYDIVNAVYFKECGEPVDYKVNNVKDVGLNFYHNDLRTKRDVSFSYRFINEDTDYGWQYYHENIFCDSTRSVTALGYMDALKVNFIRIDAGKGSLYLHANPVVFTNYFLTDRARVGYASSVFSHLDGNDIIWDEFSKIPTYSNTDPNESPLYYILQQPSLKYAWWLLLITALLYVFFASRRRQRAIPVREPKRNTSLEFVNMISRLHYKNGNHLDMAHKKMKYFLYFVRSRYGIQTEKFREEHIRRLAEKSKVHFSEVEVIFTRYYLIEEKFKTNIEANRLVDLYDSIDNFYKRSK